MRSRLVRGACAAALLAALVIAAVMVPALAFATPGDSDTNAIPLTIGVSTPGTLTADPTDPQHTDYMCRYKVDLAAGQTIVATYTTSPTITEPDIYTWAAFPTDTYLSSDTISSTVHVIYLLAPKNGLYYLTAYGRSAPDTFTIDSAYIPAINFSLSKMSAPKKAKKKKSFKVGTTLVGEFDQLNIPVKFFIERKSGKKWKGYSSAKAKFGAGGDAQHVPFTASLKLPKGTFRVRARFTDAAHPHAKYNLWKTITVR